MTSIVVCVGMPGVLTWAYGLVANGSTQANAYELPALRNVFGTVGTGLCCKLPAVGSPTEIVILHRDFAGATLTIWPPAGWQIDNNAPNASVAIGVGGSATFMSGDPNAIGTAIWYTR